jgi:carbon-monoxide dehydrogenase large subunit
MSLPPVEGLFDGADVVVRQRMVNRRVAPAPMEPRTCAATWDGSRLTYHASTQGAGPLKEILAATLGLASEQVRVISADVGGGFGSKGLPGPEELVVAWLALTLGGTVRWAETRSENLTAMGHGRAQLQDVEIGATRDGRIVGLRMDVMQDAGAYPDVGAGLPAMTMLMSSGVYAIPRIGFTSRSYLTNTTPTGAFRGAGRPEAAYALERILDVLADELGMDPVEVRRRNLIAPDAFPVTTAVGAVYDVGDYATALDKALAAAGYDELRAEQARRRATEDTRQLGIGVSCYVEITGAMPGPEPAAVTVEGDGSATVFTGSTPHGQGHETSWAMIASDRLGIPMERITVVYGDTDRAPAGVTTGGSRSAQVCGVVVGRAADAVVALAREQAAGLLEAAVDDVVFDAAAGRFHVAGAPSIAKSWADVAGGAGGLSASATFEPVSPTFPFGTNVAVVEVDTDTGRVTVERLVGCDDAGRVLNPLLFEGQLHGGMAQGVAQALVEEVAYDADGNPLTATFADYSAVSAAELPSFELIHNETPTPLNVVDAVSHLGVRHIDMPTTPQRVWEAIRGVAR